MPLDCYQGQHRPSKPCSKHEVVVQQHRQQYWLKPSPVQPHTAPALPLAIGTVLSVPACAFLGLHLG